MARLTLPAWANPDLWLDDDNALAFEQWQDDPEPYMANWFHRSSAAKGWCMGGCIWRIPTPGYPNPNQGLWTLETWEPLTIAPSLLCSCGAHGWIRNSQWVPA